MTRAYKNSAKKPTFESVQDAFRVTLPNINSAFENLTQTQQKVIDYLSINSQMTRLDVERLFDVKLTRANRLIKEMLARNIIIQVD